MVITYKEAKYMKRSGIFSSDKISPEDREIGVDSFHYDLNQIYFEESNVSFYRHQNLYDLIERLRLN